VIDRIAPTLERHTNCDILDINPGTCLWSEKLHEKLKPRSHILLEPDAELYKPYFQPLLEKENSKYTLVPKSGILWKTYTEIENLGLLNNHEAYPMGDERLEKPNDSLLLIANLGYHPGKSYLGFGSIAHLMIYQLLAAVRNHSIFQKYGLVRMMIWMSDIEKATVLPRSVAIRKKFSLESELSCEHIFEWAGIDEGASGFRREHLIDLESTRQVLANMKDHGMVTPEHRLGRLEKEIRESTNAFERAEDELAVKRSYAQELEDLEAAYERGEFKKGLEGSASMALVTKYKTTAEYRRMKTLQHRKRGQLTKLNRDEALLAAYDEILEARDSLPAPDAEEYEAQKAEVDARWEEWHDKMEGLPPGDRQIIWLRIEDRRTFRQKILPWDRRMSEPLKVYPHEFFPPRELALLDFHPRSLWPILRNNPSNYDIFEFMIAHLMITPTQSIVRGLTAAAPGAVEWILPRCPSITDPAKGGAKDPNQLAVRSMSLEMFQELFEAWMQWPFRPSKGEMLVKMGSNHYNPEDADDMGGALGRA
jgi:transcription factor 1